MSQNAEIDAAKLWIVLAKCHRALKLQVEQSIAESGLGLSDFAALEALLNKGPLTISEIQGRVLLASGSMTAAVDRLEKRGLVIRKLSSLDRRARVIELTAEGRRVIEASFQQHLSDLESLMSGLQVEEKRHLYTSLKKLGLLAAERLKRKRSKRENSAAIGKEVRR